MVKILIDEKMVQKDDKGILSLTQKGSECAKEIYEKHCFSYELLVSAGIDDKLAQKEVCKMEHDLSEESLNIPVRQHRKSGRRETVCPGLRKPLMRVYSRNVLSKP